MRMAIELSAVQLVWCHRRKLMVTVQLEGKLSNFYKASTVLGTWTMWTYVHFITTWPRIYCYCHFLQWSMASSLRKFKCFIEREQYVWLWKLWFHSITLHHRRSKSLVVLYWNPKDSWTHLWHPFATPPHHCFLPRDQTVTSLSSGWEAKLFKLPERRLER